MRKKIWVLEGLFVLMLASGCKSSDKTITVTPTRVLKTFEIQKTTEIVDSELIESTPDCPPATGEGTILPAVSIYSITFFVNGVEQVVQDGDKLEAMVGDEIEVREATICTGTYTGNGGEACVDFAPLDQSGQEIMSEHAGTHMVRVTSGFVSIPGPSHIWTLAESWGQISAVLNHWPPEETEDDDCANRHCEHDDWVIIDLR